MADHGQQHRHDQRDSVVNHLIRCKPWIEAALEHSGGTHEWQDIVDGIISGKMQLWPAEKGCLVTELVTYPRKLVLNVFLGGGDLEQLVDMHAAVEDWGKAQGCSGATIIGRAGWERVYKDRGWKRQHVVLAKEFDT